MPESKAFLLEPETAPAQQLDRRVYALGNRSGSNGQVWARPPPN